MLTRTPPAMLGSSPIETNSPVPIAKPPTASARMVSRTCRLIGSADASPDRCRPVGRCGPAGRAREVRRLGSVCRWPARRWSAGLERSRQRSASGSIKLFPVLSSLVPVESATPAARACHDRPRTATGGSELHARRTGILWIVLVSAILAMATGAVTLGSRRAGAALAAGPGAAGSAGVGRWSRSALFMLLESVPRLAGCSAGWVFVLSGVALLPLAGRPGPAIAAARLPRT